MLQAFGLSYEPSPVVGKLFQDLSLSVHEREKVVLMGNNGSGKTKLIEILAGLIQPDQGHVVRDPRCRIGYLPQDIDLDYAGTLHEYLSGEAELPSGILQRACARMELDPDSLARLYSSLSVGERVRASLARIMLDEPTLLLLDEPTNHLDVDGRRWLTRYLESSRIACLMVSHDRAVINEVADRVLVLAERNLKEFRGGFDAMVQELGLLRSQQAEQYERQASEQRRLARSAERMAVSAARITKKKKGREFHAAAKPFYAAVEARMQARAKAVRTRMTHALAEKVDKPYEEDAVAISFNTKRLKFADALTVRGLRKSFDERVLFQNLSFTLSPGDRLALVGGNGAGKTTLMRILLGEEHPDGGEIAWSDAAVPAFMSQERTALDLDRTVLEALDPNPDQEHFARTLLARLRMRGDAVHKPMHALSVGERTKAELTSILMTEANVLLLDEPTNHLDVDSLEALEDALRAFEGAILFTSHDEAFVERVATGVLRLGLSP